VIGTPNAVARAYKVANDEEMAPFSTFESMPVEMPAAAPSAATVRPFDFRKLRISSPIEISIRFAKSRSSLVDRPDNPRSESVSCDRGKLCLSFSSLRIQATAVWHGTSTLTRSTITHGRYYADFRLVLPPIPRKRIRLRPVSKMAAGKTFADVCRIINKQNQAPRRKQRQIA
jgi:hypothetical protein